VTGENRAASVKFSSSVQADVPCRLRVALLECVYVCVCVCVLLLVHARPSHSISMSC
jgi:hypothetical protein